MLRGLLELEFATLELEGVNGFAVDIDHGVLDRRVGCGEVEVDPPEGLLFVVPEEGVLD